GKYRAACGPDPRDPGPARTRHLPARAGRWRRRRRRGAARPGASEVRLEGDEVVAADRIHVGRAVVDAGGVRGQVRRRAVRGGDHRVLDLGVGQVLDAQRHRVALVREPGDVQVVLPVLRHERHLAGLERLVVHLVHALADVPGGQAEAELADVVAVHHRAPEVRELELAGVVGTGAAALRDHAALQGAGAVEAEPVLARAEVEPVVHAVIDAARLAAGQVGEL